MIEIVVTKDNVDTLAEDVLYHKDYDVEVYIDVCDYDNFESFKDKYKDQLKILCDYLLQSYKDQTPVFMIQNLIYPLLKGKNEHISDKFYVCVYCPCYHCKPDTLENKRRTFYENFPFRKFCDIKFFELDIAKEYLYSHILSEEQMTDMFSMTQSLDDIDELLKVANKQ